MNAEIASKAELTASIKSTPAVKISTMLERRWEQVVQKKKDKGSTGGWNVGRSLQTIHM